LSSLEIFNTVAELSVLDKKQIARIEERLPEYQRGRSMIGHSTSQTSYSLQTMTMLSDSPISRMKQCLAQIDKRYRALQEAYYGLERKKLTIFELQNKTDNESKLTVRECKSQIEMISVTMNTSLRQIGMFQDMYDGIKKNNNIPDNWNERDFEEQEMANMIRSCFRIGIQDLTSTGRCGKAFVEYCEQLGIHPQLGEERIVTYLNNVKEIIVKCNHASIELMFEFLDEMVKEFGEEYRLALKRIGLDGIGSEYYMAEGATKPQ